MTTCAKMLPFSDRDGKAADMEEAWAIDFEYRTRNERWMTRGEIQSLSPAAVAKIMSIPARDAGDVCHVCGELVTWVDHLPPRDPGSAVRCFKNVRYPSFDGREIVSEYVAPDGHVLDKIEISIDGLETPIFRALVEQRDVVIDDIFPRVDGGAYELNSPKHPDYHDTFSDIADSREDF